MAASTPYNIDRFVEDVRSVFATHKDPRAEAQGVAKHMESLLAEPGLADEIQRRAAGRTGRIDLHVDEEYGHPGRGFCLMTSLPDPKSPQRQGERAPHDHGASWVVYGVYKGATEQVKYRWAYPKEGSWTSPELRECERFVQRTGQVAFFLPGEIHQTGVVAGERAMIIRLEGQRLDHVLRHAYNLKTQAAILYKAPEVSA